MPYRLSMLGGAVQVGVHGAVEDGSDSVGALGGDGVRHVVAHG